MKWWPSRVSYTAFRDNVFRYARTWESLSFAATDSPDVDAVCNETLTIDAKKIRTRKLVPFYIEEERKYFSTDYIGAKVIMAVEESKRELETLLRDENLYCDTEGLNIDVVVDLVGRAWPELEGVTVPKIPV